MFIDIYNRINYPYCDEFELYPNAMDPFILPGIPMQLGAERRFLKDQSYCEAIP